MDWLGISHLAGALVALCSGLGVVLTRKGTRRHRQIGWVYVGSMAVVVATAFMIYDLFGRFGPFHVAATLSGISVLLGVVPARRRRPRRRWIVYHAYWMTGSYVGLAAAAVAEVSTRVLDVPFGLTVALATLLVITAGVLLMRRLVPVILRRFGIGGALATRVC